MKKILKYILISVSFLVIFSCEKDFDSEKKLIGSWKILTPDNDTIVFKNESSFTRKYYDRLGHSFEYNYDNDSITIQYKGPDKILVQPSTHFYKLKNNELLIDFSNGCYGFDKKIYTLTKFE